MHHAAARYTEKLFVLPWRRRARADSDTHTAEAEPLSAADLQRRYLDAVLNYVAARIGAGAEAEDVTAEVFGAAFSSLDRCPPRRHTPTDGDRPDDDPARAWLFGIARRKIADVYRRRARRPEPASLPEDAPPAPVRSGPESLVLADEATRTLAAILEALPEPQREALLLHHQDGLSVAEIGRVLGRSPGAVAQLLHRARQTVRTRGSAYFADSFTNEGKDDGSKEKAR